MTDFAGPDLPPPFLHTWSRHSALRECKVATGGSVAAASLTYATGNQGRYVPMHLPWPYMVRRVFWINGSAASGNRDFGIYTADSSPRRIYSTGSTAVSGTSAPQYVTPGTPFVLPPGDYIFAFNCSATTNAIFGNAITAALQRFAGCNQQAVGATALPDPLVPAAPTVAGLGIWGVTSTPSGF